MERLIQDIVLFDTPLRHENLLPLSFTRPIADFRVGIDTIREKWEALLPGRYSYLSVDYLREKFEAPGATASESSATLYVAGWVVPDSLLVEAVMSLGESQSLCSGEGELIAFRGTRADFDAMVPGGAAPSDSRSYAGDVRAISHVYDIFGLNGAVISDDFARTTAGRKSQPLSASNTVIGDYVAPDGSPMIFIEEGADIEGAVINVRNGPVYIGRDAVVMEGSCLRGPLALLHSAKINVGAKVYGDTTVGPYCKVGGEVNNVVMFGYSNKAHDGFLGNAVVGEWCNIGAGTNASNLKNDYSKIRLWNYATHSFMRTDLQFCGLIMGDHSKIGVNCMLNTATVMGVGVNLHGCGFPRVFIPSFSEGSPSGGFTEVSLKKFCDIADRVMARRGVCVTDADRRIFEHVMERARQYR